MLPSKDCGEPGEEGGRSWRLYWWDGTQGHGKSSRYPGHQPEILLFLVQTMLNIICLQNNEYRFNASLQSRHWKHKPQ